MSEERKTEDFLGQNAGCLSRLCRDSASLVPLQATVQNNYFSSGFLPLLFRSLSDYLGLYRLKLSLFTSTQELTKGQYSSAEGSSVMGLPPTHPSM